MGKIKLVLIFMLCIFNYLQSQNIYSYSCSSNFVYSGIQNTVCFQFDSITPSFIVLNNIDSMPYSQCITVFPVQSKTIHLEFFDINLNSLSSIIIKSQPISQPEVFFTPNDGSTNSIHQLYFSFHEYMSFLNSRTIINQFNFTVFSDVGNEIKSYQNHGSIIEKYIFEEMFNYCKSGYYIKIGIVDFEIDGIIHKFSYFHQCPKFVFN